jgi:hypothetical protein
MNRIREVNGATLLKNAFLKLGWTLIQTQNGACHCRASSEIQTIRTLRPFFGRSWNAHVGDSMNEIMA